MVANSALLKKSLLARLKETPNSAEAILLLSCFKGDAQVTEILRELLKKHPKSQTMSSQRLETVVDLGVAVDLALGELGDDAAVERTLARIKAKQSAVVLFVLSSIRHVDNKDILLSAVGLLRDKRKTINVGFYYNPTYSRICDTAVQVLSYKAGLSETIDFFPQPYSDAELVKSYNRFRRLWANPK